MYPHGRPYGIEEVERLLRDDRLLWAVRWWYSAEWANL